MASPNIHPTWYNISPSMLLSLCHHITSKAEALNQDSNKEKKIMLSSRDCGKH